MNGDGPQESSCTRKGNTNCPHTEKPYSFKVFTTLLNKRLNIIGPHLPNIQFGFRSGRSMLHAMDNLLSNIKKSITTT
jgi:hypothetical protein